MARVLKEIQIQNKTYQICSFTGQVCESNRERETLISSSGGGSGTVRKGLLGNSATVEMDPVQISSRTFLHNEFFLIDEDNEEVHIHLTNWGVPVRNGHDVQMIWVYPPHDNEGWYTTMNNLNLKQIEWYDINVYQMSSAHHRKIKYISFVLAVILAIFVKWWLFFVVGIAGFMFYDKQRKILQDELKSAINDLLMIR